MENILNINKKHYVKAFLKSAFRDFKNNWQVLVLSMIVIFVISFQYDLPLWLLIIQQVISVFVSISFLKMALDVVDEKKINIKQIFTNITIKQFFIILVASILMGVLTLLGTVLLIIPGIIVAIALSLVTYAVLDKDKNVFLALDYSWQITKGNRFKMFILGVIGMLLTIIGLITFGLGMIVVIPIIYLMQARLYRELSKCEDMSCDCSDGMNACSVHSKKTKEECKCDSGEVCPIHGNAETDMMDVEVEEGDTEEM